jgi:hypothetical protein
MKRSTENLLNFTGNSLEKRLHEIEETRNQARENYEIAKKCI